MPFATVLGEIADLKQGAEFDRRSHIGALHLPSRAPDPHAFAPAQTLPAPISAQKGLAAGVMRSFLRTVELRKGAA